MSSADYVEFDDSAELGDSAGLGDSTGFDGPAELGEAGDSGEAGAAVRAPIPQRSARLVEPPESKQTGAARPYHDSDLVFDRALGAFQGAAAGDAFGQQTRGSNPVSIQERYGAEEPTFPNNHTYHRVAPNHWSGVADGAILAARTLAKYTSGSEDPAKTFAGMLQSWTQSGFPEIGGAPGVPDSVSERALSVPGFLGNPIRAAQKVSGAKADNGAILRAVPCAFTLEPAQWGMYLSDITHADERSAAACGAFAVLIDRLSRIGPGKGVPKNLIGDITKAAKGAFAKDAAGQARERDFMARITKTSKLSLLELGERTDSHYVVKTMACAVWTLRVLIRTPPAERTPELFTKVMRAIARQGGEAGVNCAVAGAVMGALMGGQTLPDWTTKAPNMSWCLEEASKLLEVLAPTWGDASPPAGW